VLCFVTLHRGFRFVLRATSIVSVRVSPPTPAQVITVLHGRARHHSTRWKDALLKALLDPATDAAAAVEPLATLGQELSAVCRIVADHLPARDASDTLAKAVQVFSVGTKQVRALRTPSRCRITPSRSQVLMELPQNAKASVA
jgi:hypothetical protein